MHDYQSTGNKDKKQLQQMKRFHRENEKIRDSSQFARKYLPTIHTIKY